MELFLTRTFQKNFQKPPNNIQNKVETAIHEIYISPFKGEKLVGALEGEFSYRVGQYRIIYSLDEKENIWIETVRHRKDVYRKK